VRKILALSVMTLLVSSSGSQAGVLQFPGPWLNKTGDYNTANSLGVTISGDSAVYLVTTMEFNNPGGTLSSGQMWNHTAFFGPSGEAMGIGQAAGRSDWSITGNINQGSGVSIVLGDSMQLVLKVDQVAGTALGFVNPNLSQPEPGAADITVGPGWATAQRDINSVNIRGGDYSAGVNDNLIDFSNVSVYFGGDTPFIPEPSTFALSAFGLLGLFGFGRRRKR
jgi:hypothetical protein